MIKLRTADFLAIAAGGASGALLRAAIDASIGGGFPLATLLVNFAGTLLLACLHARKHRLSLEKQLFFMVGFCGSLTTVSGMAWDLGQFLNGGNWSGALLYLCLLLLPSMGLAHITIDILEKRQTGGTGP